MLAANRERPWDVPGYRGYVVSAGAEFWDQFFRQRLESGDDLDWAGAWTRPFLAPLRQAGVRTILELGCGTGNDAARLAGAGYSVTAVDLSAEAIGQAQARYGPQARFMVADVTRRLPFPGGSFDAVMSNVAVHMFPDGVTRAVFAQVGRLVRAGGLFVFHVNSLRDRRLLRGLPARAPGRMAAGAAGPGPGPAPQDGRAVQACLARHSPPLTRTARRQGT